MVDCSNSVIFYFASEYFVGKLQPHVWPFRSIIRFFVLMQCSSRQQVWYYITHYSRYEPISTILPAFPHILTTIDCYFWSAMLTGSPLCRHFIKRTTHVELNFNERRISHKKENLRSKRKRACTTKKVPEKTSTIIPLCRSRFDFQAITSAMQSL